MKGDIVALAFSLVFVCMGTAFIFQGKDFNVLFLLFFGACALIMSISIYKKIRWKRHVAQGNETPGVVLRDGANYCIEVSDEEVALSDVEGDSRYVMAWDAVTDVFVIAIDDMPVGSVSYVLHQGDKVLEIPMDAEGNEAFLSHMQEKLPGFDNEALIEAMGMLHGHKRLFGRE